MKPIYLLALLCFSAFNSFAQLTAFGGAQQTGVQYQIRGASQPSQTKTGFVAGIGLKTLIEGPAYFSPLLSFSQKGYTVRYNQPAAPPDSGAVKNDATVRALEFSPLVQFNFSKKADYLYVRFGPSVEINLSGTERFDSANGKTVNRAMPFAFDQYSYATVSLNTQLGFQHHSGLTMFAFYHHGVGSLNNADYGPTIFFRAAGLALGWKFGRKR